MTEQPDPTEPLSRRERPAKPALTREGIVQVALRILDEEGLRKVTMRRVAASLDTGASSLYVYVRNTEDLHVQILDALLGTIRGAQLSGSWREQLVELLSRYAAVLFAHPEIARLTMSTHPSGPNSLALLDRMLGMLHEGGVDDRTAGWAVDFLLAYVTATAVEHASGDPDVRAGGDDDLSGLAVELAAIDIDLYPNIARVGDELLSGAGLDRFRWGLDAAINGVLATARHDLP